MIDFDGFPKRVFFTQKGGVLQQNLISRPDPAACLFLSRSVKAASIAAVLGLLVISPFGIRSADAQDTAGLSAQEILARTTMTYANCKSYQDTGVVKIVYLETGRQRIDEIPFRTVFVRPDCFRFEFQNTVFHGGKKRYIVWRFGPRVQTWWDIKPGVKEEKTLSLALGGATGVSGGSAHTIPALLLPEEIMGSQLFNMNEGKRIADAKLDSVDCFRIEGKWADWPRTVWVDQKTFLILRIDLEMTFPNFRTQQMTTYEPVIDGPVAQELLEFDPPVKK